ncbi:MAG: glycoside hydrolase family 99-like domain-containing protein [Lachnospiraceae bacterium]|nr:glycoside hydrolase family 99-like domain-containing protein [Lachnospiraceae bacterium]
MRVICMYLPQYHTFPENDEWWGKGYTEWTAVKKGRPLFKGHIQPRVPLDGRYYDLVNEGAETLKWQAETAKKYGVYGFSIYQYWFKGKQLMQRPMEILLEHPEIDLNYCICWANESWTRTWYGLSEQVLMKQEYGDEEDWYKHFEYLLKFFNDKRYIKIDNKPVLQIYRTFDIEKLDKMRGCFDKWAHGEGFDGIYLIAGKTAGQQETRTDLVDGYYYFEPGYTLKHDFSSLHEAEYNMSVLWNTILNKTRRDKKLERSIPASRILGGIMRRDYKENEFPGLMPDWDNTPRRGYKGLVYKGTSPEKFEEALRVLKDKKAGHDTDFVFVNAWNEWGEGAMIEPDEYRGYGYLEAIKHVMTE